MPSRSARAGDIGVMAAVALALCCAMPAIIGVGAGLTILGLGFRSWLAVLAGVAVIALGALRWRQYRRCQVGIAGIDDDERSSSKGSR
jgi:hypothetical protein